MRVVEKLGLTKIYDLRTVDERNEQLDRVSAGETDVVVDVLADAQGAGPAELLHLLSEPQEANARLGGGRVVAMFIEGYQVFVSLPSARAGFARLFGELAIDKYTGIGVEKEILLSILGVRSEYLEASFREMRDQFGNVEDYFTNGLGIDFAQQQVLCEQFIEYG